MLSSRLIFFSVFIQIIFTMTHHIQGSFWCLFTAIWKLIEYILRMDANLVAIWKWIDFIFGLQPNLHPFAKCVLFLFHCCNSCLYIRFFNFIDDCLHVYPCILFTINSPLIHPSFLFNIVTSDPSVFMVSRTFNPRRGY